MDCFFTTSIACLAFFAGVEFSVFINGPNVAGESEECIFTETGDVTEEDSKEDSSDKKRKYSKTLNINVFMNGMTKEELKEMLADSNGDKYFFSDNTTFIKEQNITVESGANFYNGSQPKKKSDKQEPEESNNSIIDQLKNVCFGDRNVAATFLSQIKGMKNMEITALVHEYVKANKISEMSSHRDLWRILHDNALYNATESNWNTALSKF